MVSDPSMDANSHPSTDNLFRNVGISIFCYYGLLLAFSIIAYLFTGQFKVDITYLLVFWMAYAIKNGSTAACKWGIFFMLVYGVLFIVGSFDLLFKPAVIEFYNRMILPATRPFYLAGMLVYVLWSIANLKYLVRILKLRQVHYWTKGVILGYGIVIFLIACFWVVPSILNDAEGYSRSAIETKYGDVIGYLKRAAKDEVPTMTNASEVLAISQTHPEIISASIRFNQDCSGLIISKYDFDITSSWNQRGSGIDKQGNKIKYVTYEDYTKNANDRWVKIKLLIGITEKN